VETSTRRLSGLARAFALVMAWSTQVNIDALAQSPAKSEPKTIDQLPYSNAYPVVELRRYTIKPGQRDHFARYFDAWFPEAFQQLGALAVGQFLEQDKIDGFTWIRAFRSLEDFAIAKSAFYYGPVWREHKKTLNDLMVDSDNVLLLTPQENGGIAMLPAVDPVLETTSSRGLVLAQLIKAKPEALTEVTRRAAAEFDRYRAAGARQAALLVTLSANNPFPQHPIRTDGPYLVWMGLISDDAALKDRVLAQMQRGGRVLTETSLLQGVPETIVMTPTPRSRLRSVSYNGTTDAREGG